MECLEQQRTSNGWGRGMTSRVLKIGADRIAFVTLLQSYKLPCTVKVTKGQHRSVEQNRLQWLWMNEAAEQLGEYTASEYQAICKLELGVPILRGEDAAFRDLYDSTIKPLPYEAKLKVMGHTFDFGVTSKMKTGQKKRYLDDVYEYFTAQGVQLTEPSEIK